LKPRLQKHKTGLRRFNSSIREGGFRELVAANLFAGLDIRRAGYSPGWIFAGLDIRRAGYSPGWIFAGLDIPSLCTPFVRLSMLLCRPKGQDTKKAPSPRAAALFYATFICRHQFWQRDIIMADQGRQIRVGRSRGKRFGRNTIKIKLFRL
jgi:hypothetical protein